MIIIMMMITTMAMVVPHNDSYDNGLMIVRMF